MQHCDGFWERRSSLCVVVRCRRRSHYIYSIEGLFLFIVVATQQTFVCLCACRTPYARDVCWWMVNVFVLLCAASPKKPTYQRAHSMWPVGECAMWHSLNRLELPTINAYQTRKHMQHSIALPAPYYHQCTDEHTNTAIHVTSFIRCSFIRRRIVGNLSYRSTLFTFWRVAIISPR